MGSDLRDFPLPARHRVRNAKKGAAVMLVPASAGLLTRGGGTKAACVLCIPLHFIPMITILPPAIALASAYLGWQFCREVRAIAVGLPYLSSLHEYFAILW